MSSVNKALILGNLGADPEVKTFQNGNRVCNLRVATSEKWTDKQSGEKRERTEWHQVAIFNDGIVGVAEKYLRKGSKIYVEGQLETRKWQDQSGNDRYTTEVVLRPYRGSLVLLDGKPQGDQEPDRGQDQRQAERGPQDDGGRDQRGGGGSDTFYDEEVPFGPEVRV